jgi:hypothetical protein
VPRLHRGQTARLDGQTAEISSAERPTAGVGLDGRRGGKRRLHEPSLPSGKDMHMLWTIIVVIVIVLAVIGLLSILRRRSV